MELGGLLFYSYSYFADGEMVTGGGNGGGSGLQGTLTRADLCQDMNFAEMSRGIKGIQ